MKQKYIHPEISLLTMSKSLLTTTSDFNIGGHTSDTSANEAKDMNFFDDDEDNF